MDSNNKFYERGALDRFIEYVRTNNIKDCDNKWDIDVELYCFSEGCGNSFMYTFSIEQLRTLKQLQSNGAGLSVQHVLNILELKQKCSKCVEEDEKRLEEFVEECLNSL